MDKMRWRYGDTNPVIAAVDSTTAIEIGDLLFLDTDDAQPAAALTDSGVAATNQEQFAGTFLGVAMQRSRMGDTDPIRVATTGVFEFDCASGTFELGNLMGVASQPAASALLSQQVTPVTLPKAAVGRIARREPLATSIVYVDIRSTVMTGGVEGSSYSG